MENIRNFAIIAHIDHGKSTISDRLIEECGLLDKKQMCNQILDSMDIERERGITIKAQTVRLSYTLDNVEYILNLMDTPGHVDFSYEVSRCLASCEGALLVVDAAQGVEAQTLANAYKAVDNNLVIIPVINKVDLPSADVEICKKQIEEIVGIDAKDSVLVSGKTGFGIKDLLEHIIYRIPSPQGKESVSCKVLLVDASYDVYLGVVMIVRVIDGSLKKGDRIKMLSNDTCHMIEKIGIFAPHKLDKESLEAGEIGFICANVKHIEDCNIGDTIVAESDCTTTALAGFQKVQPVVFCGLYPIDSEDYVWLKEAIGKLCLNDSSISYEVETSQALGFGFRCGFLGMLHMEVVQERLEREFDLSLIVTAPSVVYEITSNKSVVKNIHNPADFPDPTLISCVKEPIAKIQLVLPEEYVGPIIQLCVSRRGIQTDMRATGTNRVAMSYRIPMSEIVTDFHEKVKSVSRGYASFEWEADCLEESKIVKVSILINGEEVDALSFLSHISSAESRGRKTCTKLKETIPRQMFAVALQAAIGGKIIARESISPMRKDVTSKCYGGDITRKKKLLEKQKKGKKKMKMLGSVEVPQSAFVAVLKNED